MIYKTLKKVSNVCQLLDKSKYNPSQTRSGITWTNNGDGSWTANGIAEKDFAYVNINQNIPFSNLNGHIIYICIDSTNLLSGVALELKIQDNKGNTLYYRYNIQNEIINLSNISSSVSISISAMAINKDIILENYTFKPQLFDLTEMYGAGHEPTTVEQFRQDFPEEMYDYSPHCFVKSYKDCLTCKTKNLFDINSVTEVRHIRTGSLKPTTKWSIKNNSFITTLNNYSDGVSYILPTLSLEPGIYTFSAFCTSDYKDCWFGIYDFTKSEGFDERYTANKQLSKTFEITEKSEIGLIMQGYNKSSNATYSNVQLELGDTATDYVPYGHLTSYKKSLMCKTKNLWTCDKTMLHVIYNSGTQVFKVTNTGSSSCYTLPTPIPAGTTVTITIYCLSGFIKNNESDVTIGGYHNETGNTSWQCHYRLPSNIDLSGKSFSSTFTTTNTLTDFWIFVYASKPDNLQFKVQLELGDTATEYHPYGYL